MRVCVMVTESILHSTLYVAYIYTQRRLFDLLHITIYWPTTINCNKFHLMKLIYCPHIFGKFVWHFLCYIKSLCNNVTYKRYTTKWALWKASSWWGLCMIKANERTLEWGRTYECARQWKHHAQLFLFYLQDPGTPSGVILLRTVTI